MNYSYEIVHDKYVKEIDHHNKGFNLFHIDIEICDQNLGSDTRNFNGDKQSFRRCRKWLSENYLELMI